MTTPARVVWLGLLALVAAASPARALDQSIRGQRLIVRDSGAVDGSGRKVSMAATEAGSPETVIGDPTRTGPTGGAILTIIANGPGGAAQRIALPQGTDARGRPLWRAIKGGFKYADAKNVAGPVKSVVIKKVDGAFAVRASVSGVGGPVDIVPPDPGTDGFVTLKLAAGDRYCVRFGADGRVQNRTGRIFKVGHPVAEGCPPSGELLALSYNVAGLPEGISGSHPATNTSQISPRLNPYDLVVVQESWQTPDPNPLAPLRVYHEILAADVTHAFKSLSAPLPLGTDPSRPSALVSDGLNWFSRYPFTDVVRVPWAGCHETAADCLALKGFARFRATVADGVTIDVYDLHMEAGGAPEDDVLRDQGAVQLANFINANSAGRPVIVGGDFNLHSDEEPDGTTFQNLLALVPGLQDVCAALSCPQPGRIDKFLFRNDGGIVLTPRSWRFETDVFVDAQGEQLSDHDALAVRFDWTIVTP